MPDLIPKEEITTLKSAADVKEVADNAVAILEQQSMATLINQAANTGQHSAVWGHPISKELEKVLKGQGYKITKMSPDFQYKIEGF